MKLTASSPLKIGQNPKGNEKVFQASIFRCENVSFREGMIYGHPVWLSWHSGGQHPKYLASKKQKYESPPKKTGWCELISTFPPWLNTLCQRTILPIGKMVILEDHLSSSRIVMEPLQCHPPPRNEALRDY